MPLAIGGGLAMQMQGTSVHRWECMDDECGDGETRPNRPSVEVSAYDHAAKTGHDVLVWKLACEIVHMVPMRDRGKETGR